MRLKGIIDEDFVNFKKCSMFVAFPTCNWKCGGDLCQNSKLATSPDIEISEERLVQRYINNPLSEAIVCGGLEPFDSFPQLTQFISKLREVDTESEVVIYTGYNRDEIEPYIKILESFFDHIIVKFGRYIPNQKPHRDEVLGVNLQSDNQYGEVIS